MIPHIRLHCRPMPNGVMLWWIGDRPAGHHMFSFSSPRALFGNPFSGGWRFVREHPVEAAS